MKISIIIPTQNNLSYLNKLMRYLKEVTQPEQIKEIIIVNGFEDESLIKLAEKAHAKLYIFKGANHKIKIEAGAFEATGDVLYFIKPGFFPPKDFSFRILAAISRKHRIGTIKHYLMAAICRLFHSRKFDECMLWLLPINNFFILRNLFHFSGGLMYKGKIVDFRNLLKRPAVIDANPIII